MNLFKRARSTTGKGTGLDDSPLVPSSSRSPSTTQDSAIFPALHTSYTPSNSSSTRKLVHRDGDELANSRSKHSSSPRPATGGSRGFEPPSRSPSRIRTYTNNADLYTQNDLTTFVFGAAPSPSTPSNSTSVDPFTLVRDEADSDDLNLIPDITPRPSVVGGEHHSHQSLNSRVEDWQLPQNAPRPLPRGVRQEHEREGDSMSIHRIFNDSSASASASSLSRTRGSNSRSTSRVSSLSSMTPQTSGNDLSSDDDGNNDNNIDGRHPIPIDNDETLPPSHALEQLSGRESPLYLSEEELDIYGDEDDNDLDSDEPANQAVYARRGSAAIAIPNTPSDRGYGDKEDSISTLRRASRSLDEMYSFSFAKASGPPSSASRSSGATAVPPLAPSSVPESEGELQSIRKRSLPPIAPNIIVPGQATSAALTAGPDSLGFDTSWLQDYGRTGLVGINSDEMADIVGGSTLSVRRPSSYSFRKGSAASAVRRQSTFSNTSVDIMLKNIHSWNVGSQKYIDQKQLWLFERETEHYDLPALPAPANSQRPSISSFFSPRNNNSMNDTSSNLIAPFLDAGHNQKEKSKDRWKGMPVDSEEIWTNRWIGRFKMNRKNTSQDPNKLQQRLNFQFMRSHNGNGTINDGPPVTIHKHSKAVAFSIGRHYRTRPVHHPHNSASTAADTSTLRNASSRGQLTTTTQGQSESDKKKAGMILLAPRHVQISYTSTTTTRKLESHGLLDEAGRKNPKDLERLERMRKEKEREDKKRAKAKGKKDKDRAVTRSFSAKGKEKETASAEVRSLWEGAKEKNRLVASRELIPDKPLFPSGPSSSKSKAPASRPDIRPGSSKGSDPLPQPEDAGGSLSNSSNPSSNPSATTTPDPSEASDSSGSVKRSVLSEGTVSSDRTIAPSNFMRRRGSLADEDEEDYDSYDDRRRQHHRTPYRETYAALPPEVFEAAHQEHQSHRLFGWGKSKAVERAGPRNYLEVSYTPPWALTQPRHNSETKKGIVDDLNMSFQDVGLLPAIGEVRHPVPKVKPSRRIEAPPAMKAIKPAGTKRQVDVFADVHEDALYMLLPLWPGETDPGSMRRYPFTLPPIPVDKRTYLLVYYKLMPPKETGGKPKKKRSKNSPTSSYDSVNRQHDDRNVMLNDFNICGRIVSYYDLQGTSVRIPDQGLAVSGSLQEAYESIPTLDFSDVSIIGLCTSREAGVEFMSDAFDKMGLSYHVPNPKALEATDDDSESVDTLSAPTSLGRAVMEMAWLGAMAVTSFHREPHWRG